MVNKEEQRKLLCEIIKGDEGIGLYDESGVTTIKIDITHDFPSLNKFYASKHWGYRKNEKLKFFKYLDSLNLKLPLLCEEYHLSVENYTRMDTDNVVMISKFISDYLKLHEAIKDDSNRIFTNLHLRSVRTDRKDIRARATITLFRTALQ